MNLAEDRHQHSRGGLSESESQRNPQQCSKIPDEVRHSREHEDNRQHLPTVEPLLEEKEAEHDTHERVDVEADAGFDDLIGEDAVNVEA